LHRPLRAPRDSTQASLGLGTARRIRRAERFGAAGSAGVPRSLSRALGALAFASAGLLATLGAPLVHAQEPPEIRWDEISSGESQIGSTQGFELDFQNFTESRADVQFEPSEAGMSWAPKNGAAMAVAGAVDFASFNMETTASFHPAADSIYLCGGSAEALPAGTVLVGTTTEGNYVKVSIDSCGEALKFHWATYKRIVLVKKPVPGALEAPVVKMPADGSVFEHDPRDLLLVWSAVPGAASYTLELDCRGCCPPRRELFCGEEENGKIYRTVSVATSAYYTIWMGPNAGRWRVAAVGANGKPGPFTPWTNFAFKKTAGSPAEAPKAAPPPASKKG
jgi:hypothetical protein